MSGLRNRPGQPFLERVRAREAQHASVRSDFTTEYGRWLDEHDDEVRRQALLDAADSFPGGLESTVTVRKVRRWLIDRAGGR